MNATEDDKIRHEAGHVVLHWLIGNKPVSVEATSNGFITKLEETRNVNEQPWHHIMALLAGPIAEGNNDLLGEITGVLECMKEVCNQHFYPGSDSYRIFDYLLKLDNLMLWSSFAAVSDILVDCQDLLEDFYNRFKIRNELNSTEIDEMFSEWNNSKNWTQTQKLDKLKNKFDEKRGISPFNV